jgi:hypothetical protein
MNKVNGDCFGVVTVVKAKAPTIPNASSDKEPSNLLISRRVQHFCVPSYGWKELGVQIESAPRSLLYRLDI